MDGSCNGSMHRVYNAVAHIETLCKHTSLLHLRDQLVDAFHLGSCLISRRLRMRRDKEKTTDLASALPLGWL